MPPKSTSLKGRAYLKREEGEVLRAYRDVAGVWTIGCGLTAASGVVTPKAGMVISREEADRLLTLALEQIYEPSVRRAMPDAAQCEFDGAVSFHFNTGAIGKASWVAAWKKGDWMAVRDRLTRWSRGGGKVLPALRRRREREFLLMRDGLYDAADPKPLKRPSAARIALTLTAREFEAARKGFRTLGYDPGDDPRFIALEAARKFQSDHGLTVDGIVGRATLSTLQRRLDARQKSATTLVGSGLATGTTAAPPAGADLPDFALWLAAAATVLLALRLAWVYRDVLAAKLQGRLPRFAAWLRSI